MKIILLLAVPVFLFACNNSSNNAPGTVKTHVDSLMAEVMEGHNAGMAKMSRVSEAQKKVQKGIDSIANLPAANQGNAAAFKARLDSLLSRLKYADYAMNRWMEEFNMDSSLNDAEQRIKYLESEKSKIFKVNDAMAGSLKEVDSLFNGH